MGYVNSVRLRQVNGEGDKWRGQFECEDGAGGGVACVIASCKGKAMQGRGGGVLSRRGNLAWEVAKGWAICYAEKVEWAEIEQVAKEPLGGAALEICAEGRGMEAISAGGGVCENGLACKVSGTASAEIGTLSRKAC